MKPDELIALVSHELRGPAAAIGAAAQVLEESAPPSSDAAEAGRVVSRQSQRLARALDEMLELGRIVTGATPLQIARCDLAALLAACDAPGRIEVAADAAWIDTDAARLADALARVLAASGWGVRLRLEAAAADQGPRFTIAHANAGLVVHLVRVLLERGGAQVRMSGTGAGTRLEARLPR